MGAFLRSDLAAECDLAGDCGVLTDEREADGCRIFRVHVRDEEAESQFAAALNSESWIIVRKN